MTPKYESRYPNVFGMGGAPLGATLRVRFTRSGAEVAGRQRVRGEELVLPRAQAISLAQNGAADILTGGEP